MNTPARRYCFTIANGQDLAALKDLLLRLTFVDQIRYLVCQEEEAPTTKKRHLQGYCELTCPARLSQVKEWLACPTGHFEIARGSAQQNKAYCTKEESRVDGPWEYGTIGGAQGKRKDLELLADIVKEKGAEAVAELHPHQYIKFHRGLNALEFAQLSIAARKKLRPPVECHVFYGEPGAGKSRKAMEMCLDKNFFRLTPPQKNQPIWFSAYPINCEILVIEEMDNWMPFDFLKTLLDPYPLQLGTKGSHVWATHILCIICSNKRPIDWYQLDATQQKALKRRISKILKFTKIPALESSKGEDEFIQETVMFDDE